MPFLPSGLRGPLRPLVAAALTGLAAVAACAQATPEPQVIVVAASRIAEPLSSVLADVSVVDRAAIERSRAAGVVDLLARLPGIEFVRNGGPGSATSVHVRGSETRHTAVYLDGARIDSQSTGGATWEQIPLEQLERIEVLRGPAAAVYGSDAVGGVVHLFTRRGRGANRTAAAAGLGTHGSAHAEAAFVGSSERFDHALSVSHGRSDGFNARVAPTANPDDDGWRRSSVHARLGAQFTPGQRVDATLLASELRAQYDGSLKADDVSQHRLRSASLGWQGRWSEASGSRALASESRSTYESRPNFYRTETTLRNLVLQHEQVVAGQRLSATLERREDRLHNPATATAPALAGARTQDGIAFGWRGDFGDQALQAHLRHDRDSEFGGQDTGSLALGWRFAPRWRATASAATSFRAPTLYQRFSEYGVATLVPENGRNVELGLRWSAGAGELGATLWRNRVDELIVFGAPGACASAFGCYANVGRAAYDGLTLAGRHALGGVALRASLDWHDPRNLDTGRLLPRRARKLASVGADTELAGWSVGAEWRAAGARFDNAAQTQRLGGYGVVDLVVGRTLQPGLRLEARVDNVGAKAYELARSYATGGRSAQIGLRWSMP